MDPTLPLVQKSLTELRRHTPELLQEARDLKCAFMVTDRGMAAGVIVDPDSWNLLQRRLALLEQLALGMEDVATNRLTAHEAVKGEFAQWL